MSRLSAQTQPGRLPFALAEICLPATSDSLIASMQRAALMLVKGYGYSLREAAAVLELDEAAVHEHVRRGLQRLRWRMEVE